MKNYTALYRIAEMYYGCGSDYFKIIEICKNHDIPIKEVKYGRSHTQRYLSDNAIHEFKKYKDEYVSPKARYYNSKNKISLSEVNIFNKTFGFEKYKKAKETLTLSCYVDKKLKVL